MRWHGSTIGMRLRFITIPTARDARGLPARVRELAVGRRVPVGHLSRARASTRSVKSVSPRRSSVEVECGPTAREVLVELAVGSRRARRGARRTRGPASRASASSSRSGSGSNEMRARPRSVTAASSGPSSLSIDVVGRVEQTRARRGRRGSGGRGRWGRSCDPPSQAAHTGRGGLAGSVGARVERGRDLVVVEVVAVAEHHGGAFLGWKRVGEEGAAPRTPGARPRTAARAARRSALLRGDGCRSRRASRSSAPRRAGARRDGAGRRPGAPAGTSPGRRRRPARRPSRRRSRPSTSPACSA